MAKKIRKSRKTSKPVEAATTSVPAEAPQVERATADQIATGTVVSARAAAIRRSTEGKFNKQVLSAIGGKECPRFAADDVEGARCVHGEARERRCAGTL